MICANIYVKIEKPVGDDIKRIEDAIELMNEIKHAIGKCTSDEAVWEPFLDMANLLEDIKEGKYLY